MIRTLVIDNHDSFTFNLVHLLAEVNGVEPWVVRNDELSWAEVVARGGFDNIVISPGPGHPDREADFGIARDAVLNSGLPILGVCLGHQGIASLAGARVVPAPTPVHGKTARLRHDGRGLFAGLPQDIEVMRYHSWIVERPLPAGLVETAWTPEGLLMGFEAVGRPRWGVQFHPESILTRDGRRMLENFRRLTEQAAAGEAVRAEGWTGAATRAVGRGAAVAPPSTTEHAPPLQAHWRELPLASTAEALFAQLFASSASAFWLDGEAVGDGRARWSLLGDTEGPHAARIEHDVLAARTRIVGADGVGHDHMGDLFELLDRLLPWGQAPASAPPGPFVGGLVGCFGYELRPAGLPPATRRARTPDALLLRADRWLAVDHQERRLYAVALDEAAQAGRAQAWLDDIAARIARCPPAWPAPAWPAVEPALPDARADRDEATYLADVRQCLQWIAEGESYQICLTNELSVPHPPGADAFALYRTLRRVNPAPYAAFLRWPGGALLSASPERFLSVDAAGRVETKPIKGTMTRARHPMEDLARARLLAESTKDQAENVMIVDLLRNDLSRVCVPGSVVVPKLFDVEGYATVHQLVSTVRGQLRPGAGVIDLLRATFPGGSMTGAPKARTLELIDRLERRPRGMYSGALGWIGCDGAADLAIVIRTIVQAGGLWSIGAGGAVVQDSSPQGEHDEMRLKARAPLRAIALHLAAGQRGEGAA